MLDSSREAPSGTAGRPLAEFPASFAQERVWLRQRLDPGDPAQNQILAERIDGPLDATALERALAELTARHEALRTTFVLRGGGLVQRVHEPSRVPVNCEDLTSLGPGHAERAAGRRISELASERIDLGTGPLARTALIKVAAHTHVFAFIVHQIVFDEWSAGIFTRELWGFYLTAAHAVAFTPAPLTVQGADYAAWERDRTPGPHLDAHLDWWRSHLAGAPPVTCPPGRGGGAPGWAGARHTFTLPREVSEGLLALGQRAGATPFMTLLTLFQVLLARVTGQDD